MYCSYRHGNFNFSYSTRLADFAWLKIHARNVAAPCDSRIRRITILEKRDVGSPAITPAFAFFSSADCVRPNVKFNYWEENHWPSRVRFGSVVFTGSRLPDRFIIRTYRERCVCGLANMPNELDMIDSVAILRSRREIVRQMRESIKVMTVRIRSRD